MKKEDRLAVESIPRLMLEFTASTAAALFFSALYSITDALFIARGVGDIAMGGISLVFPVTVVQTAIAQTLGGGAASVVSRRLGEQNPRAAGEATANAMAAFYITAVLVSAVGLLFADPLLHMLGAEGEMFLYAKRYLTVILLGNVFSTGFSSIIRAEGKMGYALFIWLIPTAVNIIFDAVLIYGFHLGVVGAALGTVICQFTSFIMCVIFFKKLTKQSFSGARLKIGLIKDIIGIGVPTLIQMGSLSVIFAVLNREVGQTAGDIGVSAFAYMSKIITFGIVPINAAAQAAAPIVGYNTGKGNVRRVRKTAVFALFMCMLYSAAALAATAFAARGFVGIFTENEDIISLGAAGLRIISVSLPFVAVTVLAGAICQALGRKLLATAFSLSFTVILLPAALIMSEVSGIYGIWTAFPASGAMSALICGIFIVLFSRKHSSSAVPSV